MGKSFSVVALLVAVGCIAGCTGSTKTSNKTEAATTRRAEEKRAAIPVEAQMPVRGEISEFWDTTTRVEAERSVQVTSEGMGKCVKVFVDEGDKVKQGDTLAELDTSELSAQITSANAQLQKASSDFGRAKQLFAEGLISKSEYDNARFGHEQQEASVKQLNVQLENMTVRAPLTGVVTKKMVQNGQLISSGTPCFEVVDPQSYVLNVSAPEKDYLPRIKIGQKATVKLDSLDEDLTAKVRKINPAVDAASGTVKVTLDFDKAALSKLRDRAFARVLVVLNTREQSLLIPKEAILEENARKYVFVIDKASATPSGVEGAVPASENKLDKDALIANRVEIKTGLEDSARVEVLEGITENSAIVTVGQTTLKSGAEVKLTSVQDELLAKAGLTASDALNSANKEHEEQKEAKSGGVGQ